MNERFVGFRKTGVTTVKDYLGILTVNNRVARLFGLGGIEFSNK